jgi:hypothetical protein
VNVRLGRLADHPPAAEPGISDRASRWPASWRSRLPATDRLRLASVVIGMLFVLYLIYVEVVKDGRICPHTAGHPAADQ